MNYLNLIKFAPILVSLLAQLASCYTSNTFAIGTNQGSVYIYDDIINSSPTATINLVDPIGLQVSQLAVLNSSLLIGATQGGYLTTINTSDYTIQNATKVNNGIYTLAVVSSSVVAFCNYYDLNCSVYSLTWNNVTSGYTQHTNLVSLIISLTSGYLASGDLDGNAYVWSTDGVTYQSIMNGAPINTLAQVSSDQIATGDVGGSISIWTISPGSTSSPVLTFYQPNGIMNIVAVASNALVSLDSSGGMYTWDWTGGYTISVANLASNIPTGPRIMDITNSSDLLLVINNKILGFSARNGSTSINNIFLTTYSFSIVALSPLDSFTADALTTKLTSSTTTQSTTTTSRTTTTTTTTLTTKTSTTSSSTTTKTTTSTISTGSTTKTTTTTSKSTTTTSSTTTSTTLTVSTTQQTDTTTLTSSTNATSRQTSSCFNLFLSLFALIQYFLRVQ